MIVSRRSLLRAGAGVLALAGGGIRPGGALAAGPRNLVLCLTGITERTPPAQLAAAVAPFLDASLPVCLVLDLLRNPVAPVFREAAALARREPGLVEIALALGDPGEPRRYPRMRHAGILRSRARALLRAAGATAVELPVVTVFSPHPWAGLDFPAFRSAGFMGLVAQDRDLGETETVMLGREQVAVTGGAGLAPGQDAAAVVGAALRRRGDAVIVLELPSTLPGAGAAAAAAGLVRALEPEIEGGGLFPTRPLDLVQQLSGSAPASVAVVLAPPRDAAEADILGALAAELGRVGVAHTQLMAPAAAAPDAVAVAPAPAAGICLPWRADLPAALAGCVQLPDARALAPDDPARIVITADTPAGWSALDARVRLVLPAARTRAEWGLDPDLAPAPVDRLILISAADAPTPVDRLALVRSLARLQSEGRGRLFTVAGLADHVLAPDPLRDRLWSARARRRSDPPGAASVDEDERARLMEDARLAWRYIERMSHEGTGLCAGAAQESAEGRVFATRQATLWDLASQIQGIVAAQRLEIVARAEAGLRIARILDSLPEQRIDDLRLPPLFVATDRKAVVARGYDFCDTGRFLVALSRAVGAGLLSEGRAHAVAEGWDLAATLREGRPFEYGRRGWTSAFHNHCTPTLSRGLAPWGLSIASPYPDPPQSEAGDADYRMRLLDAVAHIGPYGTEPPLLEEGELGPTPATRAMAEVLFDAQLSHFERTGRLKCVSETSLNERPWFTYQGFRPDAPLGEGWVVAVPGGDASHQTPAFRERVEAVSAKGAYLWAAHYPHPYSRRLVEHVRERARLPGLGFSVGVFTRTGLAMPGYSDVNTNGIILGAIAHMLAGPR